MSRLVLLALLCCVKRHPPKKRREKKRKQKRAKKKSELHNKCQPGHPLTKLRRTTHDIQHHVCLIHAHEDYIILPVNLLIPNPLTPRNRTPVHADIETPRFVVAVQRLLSLKQRLLGVTWARCKDISFSQNSLAVYCEIREGMSLWER